MIQFGVFFLLQNFNQFLNHIIKIHFICLKNSVFCQSLCNLDVDLTLSLVVHLDFLELILQSFDDFLTFLMIQQPNLQLFIFVFKSLNLFFLSLQILYHAFLETLKPLFYLHPIFHC